MRLKTIKYESEEVANEYKEKKHYKLIILIIASDAPHYEVFKKCWMEYMNKNENIKSFFLYSNENMDTDIYITKDSITYNCKESLIPGILYKTIAGYYFCQKKLSYDFMLRTNLSSFIIFPNILKYLNSIEKQNIWVSNLELMPFISDTNMGEYYEVLEMLRKNDNHALIPEKTVENWKFFTSVLGKFYNNDDIFSNKRFYFMAGSYFILSNNIIKQLLYEVCVNNILEKDEITTIPDDVAISALLQWPSFPQPKIYDSQENSLITHRIETDYRDNLIHIRNRTDIIYGNREIDMKNMVNQVKKFYNSNFEA